MRRCASFAAPLIRDAIEKGNGDWTEREVWAGLDRADMLLWLALRDRTPLAICVTMLSPYKFGLACRIILLAGKDMDEWMSFLPRIEQYARDEKCVRMRVSGRKGWRKMLPDYDEPFITLEKVLSDVR